MKNLVFATALLTLAACGTKEASWVEDLPVEEDCVVYSEGVESTAVCEPSVEEAPETEVKDPLVNLP